jgi:tetratricopeptide (TPR) repeat protein
MQYIRLAWLAIVLLLAGCRLPGWEGPVSRSLADCRRLSQQGMVALDRGQQEKAETLLAQAVNACPVDAEARRRYAEALWRRGAQKEAIAQLEAAGRVTPDDAALWTRMAEMQLAAGQVELAGQTADRALDLDTKLPGAWAIRGGVRRAAGKPQEALADYLRALGYAPSDRAMLREVAELYRQLNQPERALQTLQSLAETYPPGEEPDDVLYLTGLAYVALGRYDDGVESLTAAVTRGKPTAEMYCQLGQAELLAGHAAEAACAARQALTLDPAHRASHDLLDRIELAQRPQGTVR